MRSLDVAKVAARSVTENRGGGNVDVGEQGDTDRECSRVEMVLVVESKEGDLGVWSKVKFSSNMLMDDVCGSEMVWPRDGGLGDVLE